jgi:Tetratricopeptide repeat
VWQSLRNELHGAGVEIVTVSLELSGPEASRPFIEAARAEHPSLLDPTHQLDTLFGVVNIPNVIWIDEQGLIVRPAEPGWPGRTEYPESMRQMMAERAQQAADAAALAESTPGTATTPAMNLTNILQGGQDRDAYPDAIRDWAKHGVQSRYVMGADEVIAASQPRGLDASRAAAHFELANQLWRTGDRDGAIRHFNECHRLAPDNWTYKRQAWSLVGNDRAGGGEFGLFNQAPRPGEEAEWPFISNFNADVAALQPGQYYPNTMD